MIKKFILPSVVRKTMRTAFKKIGIKNIIYDPLIDGLIETSLRGVDSHGIRLFPHYFKAVLSGRININPNILVQNTSLTTATVDADNTFGITASVIAMNYAIKIAKKYGTSVVVVKNSSHFGAAGIYGLMAANKNMISYSFTNVDSMVVPYAGKFKFLGTNAFCFTAPMEGETPFCLDMATSEISWNKLMMYQKQNKLLPAGCGYDKYGNNTIDPHKTIALTHFGGYKGYGIALMIEMMTSLLSGMPFGQNIPHMFPVDRNKRHLSHFFMVIDIKRFQPIKKYKKQMKNLADSLRNVPSLSISNGVKIAGDIEKNIFKNRIFSGIPLTDEIIQGFEEINDLLCKF
jgi:ureidoglycolate dehydrogenase (NAD+)